MCGICGTIGIPDASDAARAVGNMNAAMLHRGPDEQGELIAPAAAPYASIGMRRLSIIDLSGGHQPVFNEAGDVAIVFNGEIYDFSSLRAELERRSHVFRTHSDTETIVHAYEEWGEACLGRLRGMFAFAILDMRVPPNGQRGAAQGSAAQGAATAGPRLLLARDRLGIKPFYYAIVDGVLLFASEVRALLASGKLPRRLSQEALDSYLLFGSIGEPMTLVDGVFSLPPGHFMTVPADIPVRRSASPPLLDLRRGGAKCSATKCGAEGRFVRASYTRLRRETTSPLARGSRKLPLDCRCAPGCFSEQRP